MPIEESRRGAGLETVVRTIAAGGLLAYPAETMYGLGGDGTRADVIRRISLLKGHEEERGFLLLIHRAEHWSWAASSFPPAASRLAERFWPGPLTLLLPALPDHPAAFGGKVALRVPDLPEVRLWVERCGLPLLSTSANRAGEEPLRDPESVCERFADRLDLIVDGPRFGASGLPSTIVDATVDPPSIVRRGALPLDEDGLAGLHGESR